MALLAIVITTQHYFFSPYTIQYWKTYLSDKQAFDLLQNFSIML